MFGTFRLVLALLVAISHANVRIAGLNPGVIAVVCFYMISGYVMTGLLRTHYQEMRHIPRFYLDRALRIFPQYLAVAGCTLAWFMIADRHTPFLAHAPQWTDLFANVTVVPLNYFMFNGTDQFTLVPPAWSLGAELQFYLLLPLLLLWRLRWGAFLAGLLIFSAAAWGMLDSETFGYRLLPGMLTFFLLGSVLYDTRNRHDNHKRARSIVIVSVMLAGLSMLVLSHYGRLMLPYTREALLGTAVGLPLLYWLGGLPQRALDNRLGDLSYGVFLNHFLIQWTVTGVPASVPALILYLLASLCMAALIQRVIERPLLHWRRGLRSGSGVYSARLTVGEQRSV